MLPFGKQADDDFVELVVLGSENILVELSTNDGFGFGRKAVNDSKESIAAFAEKRKGVYTGN